jgi:hypothetical protein
MLVQIMQWAECAATRFLTMHLALPAVTHAGFRTRYLCDASLVAFHGGHNAFRNIGPEAGVCARGPRHKRHPISNVMRGIADNVLLHSNMIDERAGNAIRWCSQGMTFGTSAVRGSVVGLGAHWPPSRSYRLFVPSREP